MLPLLSIYSDALYSLARKLFVLLLSYAAPASSSALIEAPPQFY